MRRAFFLIAGVLAASPVAAEPGESLILANPRLSDTELAAITGKFVLPNGVSMSLSVTSDTVLNGQLILRTVLTVDDAARVSVLGRTGDAAVTATGTAAWSPATVSSTMPGDPAAPMTPTGLSVAFDRASGTHVLTPTYNASKTTVSTGVPAASVPTPADLNTLAVVPGGPAVQTNDGLVSLATVQRGTQVTLVGDQLNIAHLVGQAIATAVVNTGNDRTIDTVTNVNVDLQNAQALALGSAAMRVGDLAMDATRGMIR